MAQNKDNCYPIVVGNPVTFNGKEGILKRIEKIDDEVDLVGIYFPGEFVVGYIGRVEDE